MQWAWLGRLRYQPAWTLQERIRAALLEGRCEETLLLLEHDPVITLGRSANRDHLLASQAELERRGVEVCTTSRGGDVTYHGPGQLVGYPIFRIRGVVDHVCTMAHALQRALAPLGVRAEWRRQTPGLWVGEAKLAAFGVHVHRRVAIHGFALNVATALEAFSTIVPCGLPGVVTTSLERLGLAAPSLESLSHAVAGAFAEERGEPKARQIDPRTIWEQHG